MSSTNQHNISDLERELNIDSSSSENDIEMIDTLPMISNNKKKKIESIDLTEENNYNNNNNKNNDDQTKQIINVKQNEIEFLSNMLQYKKGINPTLLNNIKKLASYVNYHLTK